MSLSFWIFSIFNITFSGFLMINSLRRIYSLILLRVRLMKFILFSCFIKIRYIELCMIFVYRKSNFIVKFSFYVYYFYIFSYKGKRSYIILYFEIVIKDFVLYLFSKFLVFRLNVVY